jgi:hypothetical protein
MPQRCWLNFNQSKLIIRWVRTMLGFPGMALTNPYCNRYFELIEKNHNFIPSPS